MYPQIRVAAVIAGMLFVGISGEKTVGAEAQKSGRKAGDVGNEAKPPDQTPESVLREFLLAVLAGDTAKIDSATLPHPDIDVLAEGSPALRNLTGEARKSLETTPFVRLKKGDTVNLPGGQRLVLGEHVNENRMQLTFAGNPVPFIMVREGGQWKVDPGTVIAARRAGRDAANKESWPNWTPDPAIVNELQEEVSLAGYRVRPAKSYQREESENGLPLALWRGRKRADGTQPAFSITTSKLPPAFANAEPDAIVKDSIAQIAQHRTHWRQGVIERGTINGRHAARVRWTGVSKPTTIPAYSEKAMRGLVYRTPPYAKPPATRSTTPASSHSATCARSPASSSSKRISRPTSMASRPTCRKSSNALSFATRYRGSAGPTPWAR